MRLQRSPIRTHSSSQVYFAQRNGTVMNCPNCDALGFTRKCARCGYVMPRVQGATRISTFEEFMETTMNLTKTWIWRGALGLIALILFFGCWITVSPGAVGVPITFG